MLIRELSICALIACSDPERAALQAHLQQAETNFKLDECGEVAEGSVGLEHLVLRRTEDHDLPDVSITVSRLGIFTGSRSTELHCIYMR